MEIRKAGESDAGELTRISFASKRYWKYPEHYFETWRDELTISGEYIRENTVFVIEEGGGIAGFYSLLNLENDLRVNEIKMEKGVWLDHLFISPEYIGKGLGSHLMEHVRTWCISKERRVLKIMADPNSVGFYKKLGVDYIRDIPSSIPGRTLPYMEWKIR